MSNTSVKVAFAFFVVLAYPAASLARQTVSAATKNAPIATTDRGDHWQCFRRGPATAAAPNRHDRSVCWAPLDTDGPGV
jgi:hypothetical protein